MIKELATYLIKQLVDYPDEVEVMIIDSADRYTIEVNLNEQDRGKVIGRQGQTTKAIRTLISSSLHLDKMVNLDIKRK